MKNESKRGPSAGILRKRADTRGRAQGFFGGSRDDLGTYVERRDVSPYFMVETPERGARNMQRHEYAPWTAARHSNDGTRALAGTGGCFGLPGSPNPARLRFRPGLPRSPALFVVCGRGRCSISRPALRRYDDSMPDLHRDPGGALRRAVRDE